MPNDPIVDPKSLARAIVLGQLRHLVSIGLTWLVAHKVMSTQLADSVDVTELASEILGLVLINGWSAWNTIKTKWKLRAALKAPAGTPERIINQLAGDVPVSCILRANPPTAIVHEVT